MAKVSMNYKKMGIPVPVIARGINPHEVMRQSMFTLDGPVMTDKVALAGNHRLVMLDPAGGLPAFIPLSGYRDMATFTAVLSNLDLGHTWTNSYEPPVPAGSTVEATGDVLTAQTTYFTTTLSSTGYIKQGDEAARAMTADDCELVWEEGYDTLGSDAEHPILIYLTPDDQPGNEDTVIPERIEWLFNRIFVVRAGTEFAEMPILDPVLDHESLDAAHDSCIRLNKGRISNLCILDLADDTDLETYVFNTKAGETASLFVKEVTDANTGATEVKVALAPASFGTTGANPGDYTGPFSGWVEVKLPSVVINDAYIKQTTDVNGVKHANVMIDITCC